MKIILNNGTELSPIVVIGSKRNVRGENRDVLSFVFPAEAGMDSLDTAFSASACEFINIVEDDGTENIHEAYTIRAELKKEAVEVSPAGESAAAVTEERITVSMGQRTYQETQVADMEAALAALAGKEV